jgi:hypothetical protein
VNRLKFHPSNTCQSHLIFQAFPHCIHVPSAVATESGVMQREKFGQGSGGSWGIVNMLAKP